MNHGILDMLEKEAAKEIFNNGWTLEEYCLNKGVIPDIKKGQ